VSDTTGDDSSNAAKYVITLRQGQGVLFKLALIQPEKSHGIVEKNITLLIEG